MRAQTSFVFISTDCPCDVESENGWQPSGIQIWTYRKNEDFKRSIGLRKTPRADVAETKKLDFTIALPAKRAILWDMPGISSRRILFIMAALLNIARRAKRR